MRKRTIWQRALSLPTARWSVDGSLEAAFIASVAYLADHNQLDLSVLHGDGTNTVAKKGGDGIGYSGHKHQKGEKVIAIIENNGYVLAPLPVAPVNELTITHIDCLNVWPHANPRPATSSHAGHATRSVRQASRPSDD